MANFYDPLMNHLAKNNECTQTVALQLLNKYGSEQAKFNQLLRLERAKKIKRFQRDGETWIKLTVIPAKFIPKAEQRAEQDTTLEDIATIYRYLVRYSAQHYTSPGRANITQVARIWLNQRRDLIQFLNLLKDLIDDGTTSHLEFKELEAGLKESRWYTGNWDASEKEFVNIFISKVNPPVEVDGEQISLYDALGLTKEDWKSLYDIDSLRRINPSKEH